MGYFITQQKRLDGVRHGRIEKPASEMFGGIEFSLATHTYLCSQSLLNISLSKDEHHMKSYFAGKTKGS